MSYNGIKVAHIVVTDLDGCIGKGGNMPWYIPTDPKRFKSLTENGVVIMGRKTFESIGSKALPNRANIVISSTREAQAKCKDTTIMFVTSIIQAMEVASLVAECNNSNCIWIIGGASIYEQTEQYVDVLEHTLITTIVDDGDTYYDFKPFKEASCTAQSVLMDENTETVFQFLTYTRI